MKPVLAILSSLWYGCFGSVYLSCASAAHCPTGFGTPVAHSVLDTDANGDGLSASDGLESVSLLQIAQAASPLNLRSSKYDAKSTAPPSLPALKGLGGSGRGQWCGLTEHNGPLVKVYAQVGAQTMFVDFTDAFPSKDTRIQVLTTALATSGSYVDGAGQVSRLGMPIDDADPAIFEFAMSADGLQLDVYRPQLRLRSSDSQSRQALKKGTGSGWIGSIPLYLCTPEDLPVSRLDMAMPLGAEKAGQRKVIVDGADLVLMGVFSAPEEAVAYRVNSVNSFPRNMDVTVEFVSAAPQVSTEIGFSMTFLRDKPMYPRGSDDRLLYFTTEFEDVGQHRTEPHKLVSEAMDRQVSMIWRYDLASIPDHQIRLYVDETVPKRWRQSVKEGIEAWNTAFEAIGFKNAVRAVLPTDPDWPEDYDMADVRFSTISWSLSEEVSSMGISKVDPRSGEILKSDIIMSDGWVRSWLSDVDKLVPNTTSLFRQSRHKYQNQLLQQHRRTHHHHRRQHGRPGRRSGFDHAEDANKEVFEQMQSEEHNGPTSASLLQFQLLTDSEDSNSSQTSNSSHWTRKQLVGDGIRSVVMHETGHILGLRHNFKGSLGISYECTQDWSCSSKNGLSSSVMDYLPMNTPAVPGKRVHAFTPVIGAYDRLAIAYGYTDVVNDTSVRGDMPAPLLRVLEEAEAYPVCYDEDEFGEDPGCIPYDLSSDPVMFNQEQLRQLASVQQQLLLKVVAPGEPYVRYGEAIREILGKVVSIGSDSLLWVGGMGASNSHRGADGRRGRAARQSVPGSRQKRALTLYLSLLRPNALGLLPPPENGAYMVWEGRYRLPGAVRSFDLEGQLRRSQASLIEDLFAPSLLNRLQRSWGVASGGSPPLSIDDYLSTVVIAILGEGLEVDDPEEWNLHQLLVTNLKDLYGDADLSVEVRPRVLFQLQYVHSVIEAARERSEVPGGWRHCAKEGETCACSGMIRYGREGSWSPARSTAAAAGSSPSAGAAARAAQANSTSSVVAESATSETAPAPTTAAPAAGPLKAKANARKKAKSLGSVTVLCGNLFFGEDPDPKQSKQCQCLEAHAATRDLRYDHLLELHRDIEQVFCDSEGVPCMQPTAASMDVGSLMGLPSLR